MNIIAYSQVAKNIKNRTLHSDLFGREGCLVCSFASLIASVSGNEKATPESLDEFLDNNNGYLGLIKDSKSDALIWGVAIEWGNKFLKNTPVKNLYKSMKKRQVSDLSYYKGIEPCILEVITSRRTTHFVLLLDAVEGKIMDPGQGPGSEFTTILNQNYRARHIRELTI